MESLFGSLKDLESPIYPSSFDISHFFSHVGQSVFVMSRGVFGPSLFLAVVEILVCGFLLARTSTKACAKIRKIRNLLN